MAKTDNLKDFLTDVADAIREKSGESGLINPQDFSARIAAIQTGGGGVDAASPKAVNFRDYDGTILHSYTKGEFLALTELPPLPTREGLICQEWNWTFEDAQEYVSENGLLEVGATYITDDGKTRLYIVIDEDGRMEVPIYYYQSINNGVVVNWGDGSAEESTKAVGNINAKHIYTKKGNYCITLSPIDGCTMSLSQGFESNQLIGYNNTGGSVFRNMLYKLEIGSNVDEIKQYALQKCYSLQSITIPKGVILGNAAINNCNSLSCLVLPKSLSSVQNVHTCTSLRTVVFPRGVVTCRCQSCSALTRMAVPDTTELSSNAFANNYSIASFVIPKSIEIINSNVFSYCSSAAFFDFSRHEHVPTLANTSAFNSIWTKSKIIVPDALYDEWIAATNWSTYASYIIKKSDWDASQA